MARLCANYWYTVFTVTYGDPRTITVPYMIAQIKSYIRTRAYYYRPDIGVSVINKIIH